MTYIKVPTIHRSPTLFEEHSTASTHSRALVRAWAHNFLTWAEYLVRYSVRLPIRTDATYKSGPFCRMCTISPHTTALRDLVMLNSIPIRKRISIAIGASLLTSIYMPIVRGEVQSDFKVNCESWFLQGTIFTAFCSRPGGGFGAESQLDLDHCLANINGVLVCAQE